jgi:hypothetical protein
VMIHRAEGSYEDNGEIVAIVEFRIGWSLWLPISKQAWCRRYGGQISKPRAPSVSDWESQCPQNSSNLDLHVEIGSKLPDSVSVCAAWPIFVHKSASVVPPLSNHLSQLSYARS